MLYAKSIELLANLENWSWICERSTIKLRSKEIELRSKETKLRSKEIKLRSKEIKLRSKEIKLRSREIKLRSRAPGRQGAPGLRGTGATLCGNQ